MLRFSNSRMLKLDQRFVFDGQTVAWGVMGEGDPLVLIHGTPFSSQVWRRIAPLLANRWRIYFFDLIGYGLSEKKTGQNVSLSVQNELLVALLQEWQISHPTVLCHDFGGATALRAHYLNGLAYASLTLIDPVALSPWGSSFVQHVRQFEDAFAKVPDYMHDAMLKAYLQSAAFKELDGEALEIYMKPWQGKIGKPAFYRQIAQMDEKYTDEISGRYGAMDCPVKLLWGEEDNWLPLAQGKKLAERLTGGKITLVPGSGHLMQEDRPEAIVAAVLEG
ncbi:alpha/beta fold hydrolase [Kiloniella antarctica]|uniref:Alpha/beta fold hydrolase n=1 Tax=Kiloniella antarctica TaxID=1550907 RepID=A0ABW5BNF2_9PROT